MSIKNIQTHEQSKLSSLSHGDGTHDQKIHDRFLLFVIAGCDGELLMACPLFAGTNSVTLPEIGRSRTL
jgi:hypothetical protein